MHAQKTTQFTFLQDFGLIWIRLEFVNFAMEFSWNFLLEYFLGIQLYIYSLLVSI